MDLRTAIISGCLRALSDPDLDLAGYSRVIDLRDVLQQEGAKLGITEPVQDTGRRQQFSQPGPVRPHCRGGQGLNLVTERS